MSEEKRPVLLSLVQGGTAEFPRYTICDQYLRYWSGNGWTEQRDEKNAEVYADVKDACDMIQKLLLLNHEDLPCRRYRAPVFIELYTDQEIDLSDVKSWLVRVSRLLLDSPQYGNGPLAGTLGLCRIDWNLLDEVGIVEVERGNNDAR